MAVHLSEKETEAAVGERLERFERFEVALVFLLLCNSYWTTLYRRHSCRQTCHGTLVLQCTLEVYPNGDVDANTDVPCTRYIGEVRFTVGKNALQIHVGSDSRSRVFYSAT
ncbi:hypothetical protein K0M31_008412 [Melipona bicolor]|uniref:Uncharacterized protein n=1 Tax=Melipona bicolor TaxID=60889 RepID=A0AA40KKF1_9HYME|nr:hypothetical protein K0M31_008412 [Melipona bicolor]